MSQHQQEDDDPILKEERRGSPTNFYTQCTVEVKPTITNMGHFTTKPLYTHIQPIKGRPGLQSAKP